jgi:hypothetical protein
MWPQKIATIGIAAALGFAVAVAPADARRAGAAKDADAHGRTHSVLHISVGPGHGYPNRAFWSEPASGAYVFNPTTCYASHPYVMRGRQYWQLDYVC